MTPIQTVRANSYQTYISDDCLFKVSMFEYDGNLHVCHSLYIGWKSWTKSASTLFPVDSDRNEILKTYEQLYLFDALPDSHFTQR